MTTETNIEALRAEAKELKIPHWHTKKEETLREDIEKAKAEKPRKKAPRMQAIRVRENARQHKLDQLNAENPEFEHQYRLMGTDPAKIEAQGFEVVDGETLGDEIVVRTMKDSFEAWQDSYNATNAKQMEAVDDEGMKILRQNATPKGPMDKK